MPVSASPHAGSVVDVQPFGDPAGFRGWKCFVQGSKGMGAEVDHGKCDLVTADYFGF